MEKFYDRFNEMEYSDYIEENDLDFDYEDDDEEDQFIYTDNF
jgi:hypothetical protein